MLVNPALYETLDSTMREVHGLMKDFRANPRSSCASNLQSSNVGRTSGSASDLRSDN